MIIIQLDNSKNKNLKIHFSFVSAHCESSIKTGSKQRVGSAYPYLGKSPFLGVKGKIVRFFMQFIFILLP